MNEKFEQLTLEDVGVLLPEKKDEKPTECSEGHGPFAETTNETTTENNCDCKACKHDVVFKALKRSYVTYCKSCGKILTIQNKTKRK